MRKGKIKFFLTEAGWGFITDSETGKDVFAHASKCVDKVTKGDEVTYDEVDGKDSKKAAINIRKV